MKRVGFTATGVPFTSRQLVECAQLAEKAGFESVWCAEDYFAREALITVAGYAYATERVKLGTSIINPYTRHPVLIALAMATLDELSGGRAVLGLGAGFPSMIPLMTSYTRPLTAMRESVHIIREVLRNDKVTFSGKVFSIKDVTLGLCPYLTPFGSFKIPRREIPIYVAGMLPKMLEVAGEIGDGVLISGGYSIPHTKDCFERAKIGAERAGRRFGDLDTAALLITSVSEDGAVDEPTRGLIASVVAFFLDEAALKLSGFSSRDAEPVRKAFGTGGWQDAAKVVTPAMLDAFGVVGTPDECARKIGEFAHAGVKLPILFALGADPRLLIEAGKRYAAS